MKISCIQYPVIWQDPKSNLTYLDSMLSTIGKTDLIVLPEMFTTGFTMSAIAMAEPWLDSSTVGWMKNKAKKLSAVVCGSCIIDDKKKIYNRFIWVSEEGEVNYYDKRHLFSLAEENKFYEAGGERVVINYKDFNFCPNICYDLRFPVWTRNNGSYDVLIYVASWPNTRIEHWDTLLKARAIENQCYVIAVNRTGKDANEIIYNGHSQVIKPDGTILSFSDELHAVMTTEINKNSLLAYRRKFPFLKDQAQ